MDRDPLMLVYLSPSRLWAHPLLGRPSRLLGRPLDPYSLGGKKSPGLPGEGEPSGVIFREGIGIMCVYPAG